MSFPVHWKATAMSVGVAGPHRTIGSRKRGDPTLRERSFVQRPEQRGSSPRSARDWPGGCAEVRKF